MKTFSIEPDCKYTIPFIKDSLKTAEKMILFASPWSPPAWMKDSGTMVKGGRLLMNIMVRGQIIWFDI